LLQALKCKAGSPDFPENPICAFVQQAMSLGCSTNKRIWSMTNSKDTPNRRVDGKFDKGSSGNPGGRKAAPETTTHPELLRDMAFDIAEMPVTMKVGGRKKSITLYQANLAALGNAGANGDVSAARDFVKEVRAAYENEQRYMDSQLRFLQGKTPGYLSQTDPAKRARMKAIWDEEVAIAQGRRKRRTNGLVSRRRRPRGDV